MRKISPILTFFLMVTIPVMVILLSSNISLRFSGTYGFFFNDQRTVAATGYDVESDDVAHLISSYINDIKGDEEFQLYEDNGEYQDPIFREEDQAVMAKARKFVWRELIAGLIFLAITLFIYENACRRKLKDRLSPVFKASLGISAALVLLRIVLCNSSAFRYWLYYKIIGIKMNKEATLNIMWTADFAKAYLVYSTIIAIVIILVFFLIYLRHGRPDDKIFQRRRW